MSIAWRAILVAGLAAGEEATLASLTGLFQREPERAAALRASAYHPVQEASVDTPTAFEGEWL